MRRLTILSGLILAGLPVLTGCTAVESFADRISALAGTEEEGPDLRLKELEQETADLTGENRDLVSRLSRSDREKAQMEHQIRRLEREAERAQAERETVVKTDELSRIGVTVHETPSETIVRIPADLFFRSGRHTLTGKGSQVLGQIAGMIRRRHPGGAIRIEGHADTDPIKKSKNHCNFELAFKRAHAVMHYLIEQGHIPSGRIALVSHGEHKPQNPSNKAKNRRVEIIVAKQ